MLHRQRSRLLLAVLVLLILAAASVVIWRRQSPGIPGVDPKVSEIARQVRALDQSEQRIAKTVWAKELLAQKCGQVFEHLWKRINTAGDKLQVLGEFVAGEIVAPALSPPEAVTCGVELSRQTGLGQARTNTAWREFIASAHRDGWQLARVEFRHLQFDTDARGRPAVSRFYCSGHLTHSQRPERAVIEGELSVAWQPAPKTVAGVLPRRIEARNFSVRTRKGEPGFREVLTETVSPFPGSHFIDPLIVYDLDGDGTSEVLLAASNLLFRRDPRGQFFGAPLCRHPPGLIFTGIIGDFDGDGAADFLCAKFEGLLLFKGSPTGTFDEPARPAWAAAPRLRYGQTLTCGDIDRDGDLDVWLGQYKLPYDRGQMPTPFYDANDGFPSWLLLNDGQGNFTDSTSNAGLGRKRWRRAYSGSFADINDDGELDLIAASDFAGLELFINDHGRFTDWTPQALPEWHGFGMCQICSDFNADGRFDLLMIGMNVPVADRLRHYGQSRRGYEHYMAMTGPMTYGNRLFVALGDGRFQQTPLNDSIARTGWSWGCSAFDFDNDSFLDLAIVNGHESKQSVRDYETEFWLHDIYVGNSREDLTVFAYFRVKEDRTRGQGMSYGGHERNRLFLNQRGETFVEVAHLMGVGLEQDSRNVVADDLNSDGRTDLLVTTFEAWPELKQTLRIYTNALPTTGNWIGFKLREEGSGFSPAGARVTLHYAGRTAVHQLVAGDSYRSQRPNTAHFGLGDVDRVDRAEIRWINGRVKTLEDPTVNQSHMVLGKD
ncbi:MAG: CRTAC1 family protein [Verrucomicrobiia bacterium]